MVIGDEAIRLRNAIHRLLAFDWLTNMVHCTHSIQNSYSLFANSYKVYLYIVW